MTDHARAALGDGSRSPQPEPNLSLDEALAYASKFALRRRMGIQNCCPKPDEGDGPLWCPQCMDRQLEAQTYERLASEILVGAAVPRAPRLTRNAHGQTSTCPDGHGVMTYHPDDGTPGGEWWECPVCRLQCMLPDPPARAPRLEPQPCVIGDYCQTHGFIHGAEAEELRERFEQLANDLRSDPRRNGGVDIRRILDEVDARDSAAYPDRTATRALREPLERILTQLCACDDPYEDFESNASACRFCFAYATSPHQPTCIWELARTPALAAARSALHQTTEDKEDARVGPSVPRVETAGSTAEPSPGNATAAERTELEQEIRAWRGPNGWHPAILDRWADRLALMCHVPLCPKCGHPRDGVGEMCSREYCRCDCTALSDVEHQLIRLSGSARLHLEEVALLERAVDVLRAVLPRVPEPDTLDSLLAKLEKFYFPIMDGPKIPWTVIAPHERQAQRNHRQTLLRLAERGGLSPCEAVAVLEDRDWHRMDDKVAKARLDELVRAARAPQDTYESLLASWREQDQALQDIFGECGEDAPVGCPGDVVALVKRTLEELRATAARVPEPDRLDEIQRSPEFAAQEQAIYDAAVCLTIDQALDYASKFALRRREAIRVCGCPKAVEGFELLWCPACIDRELEAQTFERLAAKSQVRAARAGAQAPRVDR